MVALFGICDIGSSLRHSSISLFADDALLYCPVQNTGDMLSFQRDLSFLEQWANEWCMTINVKKCQMVLLEGRFVTDKAAVAYTLCGVSLVVVDSFIYLGVFVSSNFKRDIHIDDITSRAYQKLGMIKRVLNKAPLKVKKVAYLTLCRVCRELNMQCRPIMEFACKVWDPYLVRHETQLENIQRQTV